MPSNKIGLYNLDQLAIFDSDLIVSVSQADLTNYLLYHVEYLYKSGLVSIWRFTTLIHTVHTYYRLSTLGIYRFLSPEWPRLQLFY